MFARRLGIVTLVSLFVLIDVLLVIILCSVSVCGYCLWRCRLEFGVLHIGLVWWFNSVVVLFVLNLLDFIACGYCAF